MVSFTIIWEQQDEGYTARCMDMPDVKGKGETLEELKANMTEAITIAITNKELPSF